MTETMAPSSNATLSNFEAFHLVRAPQSSVFSDRIKSIGTKTHTSLIEVQRLNHQDGHIAIMPVQKADGSWYLRNPSSLGDDFPAGSETYPTLRACIMAAIRWYASQPQQREVYIRKQEVNRSLSLNEPPVDDLLQSPK